MGHSRSLEIEPFDRWSADEFLLTVRSKWPLSCTVSDKVLINFWYSDGSDSAAVFC